MAQRSELLPRILSGIVMVGLALAADIAGGLWFLALLLLVGTAVLREFARLVRSIAAAPLGRLGAMLFGFVYVGFAIFGLWQVREAFDPALTWTFILFAIVWGTDIGAYIAGRSIGGPKIAPRISPSKTWAGLAGGMVMAICGSWLVGRLVDSDAPVALGWGSAIALAAPMAILAQAGDFFESAMKRRAGVKDSGGLIPGHGGVFDRVDGLLPVAIVFWLYAPLVTAR